MFRNEYYDQWYEAIRLLNVIPLSSEQEDDGLFSPAEAGAVGLAATYVVAGGLMATKNPYAMATAGIILAIPDPVIVAVSAYLLS